MRMPEIDTRKLRDIKNQIRYLSSVYTPEWRFDEENPDVGTALALIYSEMFAGTIKRFNQVPEKNKTAFFNSINAKLLPAIPAVGYVSFGLAGDQVTGIPVKSKTQLIADVDNKEVASVIFETANDVYVTPASIEEIIHVNGRHDFISSVCTQANSETERDPFYLFDLNGVNLQEHTMYFGNSYCLNIKNGAWIEIELFSHNQNRTSEEILHSFLDEKNALWEYGSVEGYLPFEGAKIKDGKLLFYKSERQPAFAFLELNQNESYYIRCTVKNIRPFENLFLDKIHLAAQGRNIVPDAVNCAGVDENINEFFPFGEKMYLFSDIYFACEEALSKKRADIKLSFDLNFIRIPIDLEISDPNINWKLIMRRSDFKPDVEYDITVEDVIWEYYNGSGWARLFPENDYHDVFSTRDGTMGQHRSIDFTCPADMHKILINSCESFYIRCRILKLNNLYKLKGYYISPYIEGPNFSYTYSEEGVLPDIIYTTNNLVEESFSRGDLKEDNKYFQPFKGIPELSSALYLGFSHPPNNGPIKILFSFADAIVEKTPRLVWEYLSSSGWATLNVVDESENMSRTGIITFMGPRDFSRGSLWARNYFWIRVLDVDECYSDRKNPLQLPRAKAISINSTQAYHLETRLAEEFLSHSQEEGQLYTLLHPQVQEIEVWVDEIERSEPELWSEGEKKGVVQFVSDAQGVWQKVWIKWQEVEDLAQSGPDDRHYIIDRNLGHVQFGDGINGLSPPVREEESIRIQYRTGGGEIGNLPAGAINRTNISIGFVSGINNPEVTSGGCDQETIQQALQRTAAALKHGYRAVTASDYEALALEASRNIWKAKCFANYNWQGQRELGSVTLVILQKDFQQGQDFFSNLKEQVYKYISSRVSGNIVDLNRFYIAEPLFLELSVKVELSVKDFDRVFQVKEAVENRLNSFLNPMAGNFDSNGWEIGKIPNRTQILNSLKDIAGISFLKSVYVTAFMEGSFGRIEADLEQSKDLIFALPLAGEHEVVITVEEKR